MPLSYLRNSKLAKHFGSAKQVMAVEPAKHLYDGQGRVVKEVFNGKQSAGMHELTIDGSEYSAGLYFANITGKEGSHAIKLVKKF